MPSSYELIERSIRDFRRVQRRMILARKENAMETYEDLKEEYISLKASLASFGVNVAELDRMKE